MCTRFFFFFCLHFLFCQNISAQGFFQGSAVLGINASQIDGDQLAGYNKLGLSAGLKISFPLKLRLDGSMEMLFSQRGSQAPLLGGGTSLLRGLTLNYFEMPLYVTINDWFVEDEAYYKVGLDGGISTAYLIDVASEDVRYSGSLGGFKRLDLSVLLGLFYSFNSHWTFRFRFTNGILKIFQENPNDPRLSLRSYFLTFRADYRF